MIGGGQMEKSYNKEQEAMEYIQAQKIDIEILFYKNLFDKEFVEAKLDERYVEEYKSLSEEEKWKLAEEIVRIQATSHDEWNHLVDYAIDIIEGVED